MRFMQSKGEGRRSRRERALHILSQSAFVPTRVRKEKAREAAGRVGTVKLPKRPGLTARASSRTAHCIAAADENGNAQGGIHENNCEEEARFSLRLL